MQSVLLDCLLWFFSFILEILETTCTLKFRNNLYIKKCFYVVKRVDHKCHNNINQCNGRLTMISTSKISQDDGEPVRCNPIARRRRERILKQQNIGFSYAIEGLKFLFLFDALLLNVRCHIYYQWFTALFVSLRYFVKLFEVSNLSGNVLGVHWMIEAAKSR